MTEENIPANELLNKHRGEYSNTPHMDKLIIPAGEKEQLDVYSHVGPFDEGVSALKKEGFSLITARELAEARLLGGVKIPVSREWTWVAENFNYLPTGEILIASRDYNPLLKNAEEATACNRAGKKFYLNQKLAKELRERAEADPEKAMKSGVLLLPQKAVKSEILSSALKDEPLTYFLFRDTAKLYGQFLKENDINSVPVYHAKKQRSVFGLALWVNNLSGRSGLSGHGSYLRYSDGRVRGVRRSPAERAAPELPHVGKPQVSEHAQQSADCQQEAKVEGLEKIPEHNQAVHDLKAMKEKRIQQNRQHGVFLTHGEVDIVMKELADRRISVRSLALNHLNTYVGLIERCFHGVAALSPEYSVRLYDLLGKSPAVEFLKDRALHPLNKKEVRYTDPWHDLYDSYTNKLRTIYLEKQHIEQKTAILQALEKLINDHIQK